MRYYKFIIMITIGLFLNSCSQNIVQKLNNRQTEVNEVAKHYEFVKKVIEAPERLREMRFDTTLVRSGSGLTLLTESEVDGIINKIRLYMSENAQLRDSPIKTIRGHMLRIYGASHSHTIPIYSKEILFSFFFKKYSGVWKLTFIQADKIPADKIPYGQYGFPVH